MGSRYDMRRKYSIPVCLGLVATVSALALTGCGSSNSNNSGSTGSTVALPDNKATGTAIRIGYISPEGGQSGSLPDAREATQAAADYVNKNLGGVAGHTIELVVCKEKEDPATAHDCANRLVADNAVAVIAPVTSEGDAMVPTITGAGISYITPYGPSASEMMTDNSFVITGGLPTEFTATAKFATEHHYKKVAMIVEDAGGVVSGIKLLAGPAFQQAGVDFKIVGIPEGTPDTTAQLGAALGDHPDAVILVGDGPLCTSLLKAMTTLGSTVDKLAPQTCVGPDVVSAVGNSAVEGLHVIGFADTTSNNQDAAIFRSVMAKYAPSTNIYGFAFTGYQALLGLARVLQGMQGDYTAATVSAAMKATNQVPLPLGDGATFTCNGQASSMLKSVCGKGVVFLTVKDGKGVDPQVIR